MVRLEADVMARTCCPTCGGMELRVVPCATAFSSAAYFRCPICTHVWGINKEEGWRAQRITRCAGTDAPEDYVVLFTCPHCDSTLHFQGYCGAMDGSHQRTIPLFFCNGHGFFRFINRMGLVPGLQ
jgi:predicted RNA-binding Zn-ribbon protein involved in translation (DUF1610 family)